MSEDQRKIIFDEFWKLGDVNQQRELIGKLLIVETNAVTSSRRKYVN